MHVFPNGTVTTLSNLTNDWSAYVFDIGVAYKENTDKVIEIMTRVGSEMKQDTLLGTFMLEEPEIFGVDKFDNSAVVIKGRIKTKPIRQWQVGREISAPESSLPSTRPALKFHSPTRPCILEMPANPLKWHFLKS
ncbi:MAG: hypothetical protein U5K27_10305 [Desulfotignum sp.]|nr:hypothetical protein [Desulfotignum sp.]